MLTDAKIKAAINPAIKPYKMYDRDGLYILINPTGAKWWRFKYRINGKEKKLSLGVYPTVTLAMARVARDAARQQVASGIDPSQERQEEKQAQVVDEASLFRTVAQEWLTLHAASVKPQSHMLTRARMDKHVLPALGAVAVSKIDAPMVLALLRKIEATGVSTAHRVKHDIGMVLRMGAATGKQSRDVTVDLKGLTRPIRTVNRPAITSPAALGALLRDIWSYDGAQHVKACLKLLPLTIVRTSVLASAEWRDIDLEAGLWMVPAEAMKMDEPLIVPLATQAVEILKSIKSPVHGKYVFPHRFIDVKHIDRMTMTMAFIRMGYKDKQTAHGLRATARTLLDEKLGFRPEWIEMQLAHAVKDPNGMAYPRMKFIEQRRGMMQGWADYLDMLRVGK